MGPLLLGRLLNLNDVQQGVPGSSTLYVSHVYLAVCERHERGDRTFMP